MIGRMWALKLSHMRQKKIQVSNFRPSTAGTFGEVKSDNKEIRQLGPNAYFEDHSGDIHVAVQMPVPIKFAVAYAKAEIISDSDHSPSYS